MKPRKPQKPAADVRMHRLQLDVPADTFARYKADCVLRGSSIRLDVVNHMRDRLGLPPLAPADLPPGRQLGK